MNSEQLIERLNSGSCRKRIRAYRKLLLKEETGCVVFPENGNANHQVRTIYSGAIRTPSLAVYQALKANAPLVGIVDHASLAAVKELQMTAEPSGIAYFCGAEVALDGSVLGTKRVLAVALGVPRKNAAKFDAELSVYRRSNEVCAKKFVGRINERFKKYGISLELPKAGWFSKPKPLSREKAYLILSEAVMKRFGGGEEILKFLEEELGIPLSDDQRIKLEDAANPLYASDLAETLEGGLRLATDEKRETVQRFLSLCKNYSAIPSIIYAGGNLTEFISKVKAAGFKCIIADYKTDEEAKELYDACIKAGLLPLCRSVISSPRDKFDGAFKDAGLAAAYNECAFAVVGHEISTVFDLNDGLFSSDGLNLAETIKLYSRISAKGNKTNE